MGQAIAVIGMSCKAAGINSLEDYWQTIAQGNSTLRRYSSDELRANGIDAATLDNDAYVPVGGELDGADTFDADFFGIPPKEALYMDPQQRKFLEVVFNAFEDAGIDPGKYEGFAGVFAGCSQNNYRLQNIEKTQAGREWSEFQKQIASDKDFLATQVAYRLGLRGPALTIQTACSTSLVAVDTACKYLSSGQCDIAVAGGAYINVPLKQGYIAQEGGILSAGGECRAFDSGADGTIFSPGVGVVVLKPLDQAVADGDDIYAVIESTATNNDGNKKVSYTAPGFDGQAEVITMAQAMAGIEPEDIGYVEAHGTGTKLGDPLELQALTNAFRVGTSKNQYCAIGSVKPNIGHCDAAAGVMGLIKICLCLSNKTLPAQINFETINPEIDIKHSPFFINTTSVEWPDPTNGKRIASVSSFGVGGTNAHAIVSEAPAEYAREAQTLFSAPFIPVCANDPEAVVSRAHELGQQLVNNEITLAEAFESAVNADVGTFRGCVAASTAADAARKLAVLDKSAVAKAPSNERPVIFMFPGQGSQHVNMGRELYEKEEVFRESMDRCFSVLDGILEYDLKQVLYPDAEDYDAAAEFVKHTEVAQPALFSVSYSTAQLLISKGIRPEKMVGHSIGEYTAACLAGVFGLEDALSIVARRGQLMQSMEAGSMLAVIASLEEVSARLPDDLSIAAVNSPSITVVSGETPAIHAFESTLADSSIRTVPLHTSHAFHSHMMDPMLDDFVAAFEDVELSVPHTPFSSCVSGEIISDDQCLSPRYWADQVRSPVLFSKCISQLIASDDAICIEVGSSNALTSAMGAHDFASDVFVRHTLPSAAKPDGALEQFFSVIGDLWKHTQHIDLQQFMPEGDISAKLSCSGQQFKRDRYWIDYPSDIAQPANNVAPMATGITSQTNKSGQVSMESALKTLLHELSRVEFDDANRHDEFVSLGFESLLAAEVRASLQTRLSVDIQISDLMGELNTFDKLLQHCVAQCGETIESVAGGGSVVDQVIPEPSAALELPVTESTIAALRAEISEQTRLLRQLVDQQSSGRGVDSGDTTALPESISENFISRPSEDARLGKDPEGNPNWYVPDAENPGQYRIVKK